jgi:hypothetical protein
MIRYLNSGNRKKFFATPARWFNYCDDDSVFPDDNTNPVSPHLFLHARKDASPWA